MRIPKEEENEGRTIFVGIKMDPQSKELLTWALVKVARPSDQVLALHVIPESSDLTGKSASLPSLVKTFDSVLAVYDGFCNLKQIDLKLKLCRGSSIRKVLVRETKAYAATKLILGVSKTCHGIGSSSTSIAKYCSKKLPKDCSVIAVNNGKILFHKETTEDQSLRKTHNGKYEYSGYLSAITARSSKKFDAPRPSIHCFPSRLGCGRNVDHDDSIDHCLFYPPLSSPSASAVSEGNEPSRGRFRQDDSLALVPVKIMETLSSLSKPCWPLLLKTVLDGKKINDSKDKPSRYTSPTVVLPLSKYTNVEEKTRSIVPVRRPYLSSYSSIAFHDEVKKLPEELRPLQEKYSSFCRSFSYKELKHATSNFASENLIGRGGSSRVYKGCLYDGKELAVKVLKQSEDVLKEFVSEIETITALCHKNILSLLGFCFEDDNLILVYDLLSRGSLEETLHGKKVNKDTLSWVERYKIALGIAEALDYLHGCGNARAVIHRDVKSANILLSEDFEPRLCDFGLAKWLSSSSSNMRCNDVAGTFGYLAPEYFMYGKLDEKVDVYAFGVVLLELLSGQKAIKMGCPEGNESLVTWAKEILQDGKAKQLMDPCLGDKYDDDHMERMILAASLCIRQVSQCRPHISSIVKLLQGDAHILKWARSQVKASEEFNNMDIDEAPHLNSMIQPHINLALLDIEDDTLSLSSVDQSVDFVTANFSLEDYPEGRWSRASSFD